MKQLVAGLTSHWPFADRGFALVNERGRTGKKELGLLIADRGRGEESGPQE